MHVLEVPRRDLLDERDALGQVVKLGQGSVLLLLAVLLDLVAHATERRRQSARHVGFHSAPVALELLQDDLRDEQSQETAVDEHPDGNDELLAVGVFR